MIFTVHLPPPRCAKNMKRKRKECAGQNKQECADMYIATQQLLENKGGEGCLPIGRGRDYF